MGEKVRDSFQKISEVIASFVFSVFISYNEKTQSTDSDDFGLNMAVNTLDLRGQFALSKRDLCGSSNQV